MSHIFDTPRAWPGPKPQPEPSVELDVTLIEALKLHIQRKYKLQKDAADAWGVSSAFVSKVLHGRSKPTQAMLDDAGIVISKTFSAGSVERRALVDAATSPDVLSRQSPVEAALRNALGELFGIGSASRHDDVILTNASNAMRRAHMLSAIEREFFTKTVKDDDGEDWEECSLNSWGSTEAEYIEQFRAALRSEPTGEQS